MFGQFFFPIQGGRSHCYFIYSGSILIFLGASKGWELYLLGLLIRSVLVQKFNYYRFLVWLGSLASREEPKNNALLLHQPTNCPDGDMRNYGKLYAGAVVPRWLRRPRGMGLLWY